MNHTISPKSQNITWSESHVDQSMRTARNGHEGAVVWFTGLSGSGKSTLARLTEVQLFLQGIQCYVLDGDNIRHGLNRDLGFGADDRKENIRRIGEVANLMRDSGVICLTAFISPFRTDRATARSLCPEGSFFEVYCLCPLSTCEERDPKGLYKKARAGTIPEFTGISSPYEAPDKPDLVLDTHRLTPTQCVQQVLLALEQNRILTPNSQARPYPVPSENLWVEGP